MVLQLCSPREMAHHIGPRLCGTHRRPCLSEQSQTCRWCALSRCPGISMPLHVSQHQTAVLMYKQTCHQITTCATRETDAVIRNAEQSPRIKIMACHKVQESNGGFYFSCFATTTTNLVIVLQLSLVQEVSRQAWRREWLPPCPRGRCQVLHLRASVLNRRPHRSGPCSCANSNLSCICWDLISRSLWPSAGEPAALLL